MKVSSTANYTRLYPGRHDYGFTEARLCSLAGSMGLGGLALIDTTFSGIVYFGQFIDHDLTRDETKLADAGKREPEDTPNYRRPKLDLDSVYGKGPLYELNDQIDSRDYLYEHSKPGYELLRLGGNHAETVNGFGFPATASDLPRRPDLTAIIADDRNDENLIIAQMTVLFLKFHNRMVEMIDRDQDLQRKIAGNNIFEKAQRFVRWHYQYLAVTSFLRTVLLEEIYNDVFLPKDPPYVPKIYNPTTVPLALPIEFTMAAFRFGHSMVRNGYTLNEHDSTDRPLLSLLRHEPRQIRGSEIIDWSFFFDNGAQSAHRIDTKLAKDLLTLPPEVVSLFISADPVGTLSLPARTLRRGAKMGLPSGQDLAKKAGVARVEFLSTDKNFKIVACNDMLEATPLWYYLLHEAQVAGSGDSTAIQQRNAGDCLGPLGSRIVAEVFLAVLQTDKESYFRVDPTWKPPRPHFPHMPDVYEPVDSLMHLAEFALAARG
jgi:Animal haem peroxidase